MKRSGFTIIEVVITAVLAMAVMFLSADALVSFQKGQISTQRYIQRDLDTMVAQRYFFKTASEAACFTVPDTGTLEVYGYNRTTGVFGKTATYKNTSIDPNVTTNIQFPRVTATFTGGKTVSVSGVTGTAYKTVRLTLTAQAPGSGSKMTSSFLIKANQDSPPSNSWAISLDNPVVSIHRLIKVLNSSGGTDGFLVSGTKYVSGSESGILVAKFAENKTVEWAREYDYPFETTYMYYAIQTFSTLNGTPNGYLVYGICYYNSAWGNVFIKIDTTGNVQWTRVYMSPTTTISSTVSSVCQTYAANGDADGYMVVGYTGSYPDQTKYSAAAMKINNTDGGLVWSTNLRFDIVDSFGGPLYYGKNTEVSARDVTQVNNAGQIEYVLTGYASIPPASYPPVRRDGLFVRLNPANGAVIGSNATIYNKMSYTNTLFRIIPTFLGTGGAFDGYAMLGFYYGQYTYVTNPLMIRANPDGTIKTSGSRIYNGGNAGSGYAIGCKTPDSGYLLGWSGGSTNIRVAKTDSTGAIASSADYKSFTGYPTSADSSINDVIRADRNGQYKIFIVSCRAGGKNVIFKTDPDGNCPELSSPTSISLPISTVVLADPGVVNTTYNPAVIGYTERSVNPTLDPATPTPGN